jgi:hypothetical protein
MNYEQRKRIERAAVAIVERLARKSAEELVASEGCDSEEVGLMGEYEVRNFGLGDFEDEFAARLRTTLERLRATQREMDEIEYACWRAWVSERNDRVGQLCPGAKVYGSE